MCSVRWLANNLFPSSEKSLLILAQTRRAQVRQRRMRVTEPEAAGLRITLAPEKK